MFRTNLRSAVAKYLSVPAFQDKWEKDQQIGAGYFYALTYAPIASFFKKHQPLSEDLETKVALVFSWNPTICQVTCDRFTQAKNELAALESTERELNNVDILNLDTEKIIRELWHPVKKATSLRGSTPGVSVTKFLHFSFPHIFPMIDLNTMNELYSKTVSLKWYSIFLLDWRNLYQQSKASFDQISEAVDMPVTRVLDIMLFTPR